MTQPLAGKQILIVEDEPVFRSLLDSWLCSLGATTLLAEDGVGALEHTATAKADLIICDLAMPRMNGLTLIEHLRNHGDQTPILVISATENMADIAKALRLGVQDVVLKPVKDLNRLKETLFACIYPNMFNSRVEEEERLFRGLGCLGGESTGCGKIAAGVTTAGATSHFPVPDKLSPTGFRRSPGARYCPDFRSGLSFFIATGCDKSRE